MAIDAYRVCPACGARNKPRWEACARCGELLADVAVEKPAAARPSSRAAAEASSAAVGPSSGFSPAVVVALIAAVAASWAVWGQRPTVPAAESFTIPTVPPAMASPAPVAPAPGSGVFAEGRLALMQGRTADAVRLLGDAVSLAPGEALYREYHGKALWLAGERERALAEYDSAVRLDASSVQYRKERALAYLTLDRRDDAARDFEAVLAIDPNQLESLRALAQIRASQGDGAGSAALLRRALQGRQGDPELVQDLGYALEKNGQLDEAAAQYAAVLARVPDAQITRGRLAETLLARKRPDEAIAVLQEGIGRNPTAPLLRRSLGSVLERSGRVAEAVAAYREYVRLAPNAEDSKVLESRAAGLERRLQSEAAATQEARAGSGS